MWEWELGTQQAVTSRGDDDAASLSGKHKTGQHAAAGCASRATPSSQNKGTDYIDRSSASRPMKDG